MRAAELRLLGALGLAVAIGGCQRAQPTDTPEPAAAEETKPGRVDVPSDGLESDLATTRAFFATRPQYEQPLNADVRGVDALPDLSAATCGVCHAEIYAEWRVSTHAAAWIDPQFQEEIKKSDNRWLCLNCHTPLLAQQDVWPRALVDDDVERPVVAPNPIFDEALRDEGITCAACHVVDGEIHGPGLTSSVPPHSAIADPRFEGGDLCLRCHQANATYPGKDFICTFDTGEEWKQSPQHAEGKTCVSCHMPTEERVAAVGGPVRQIGRHWWRGAGIPKMVGTGTPPEASPPGATVESRIVGNQLEVVVTNANAGHLLPTGDPERWIQLDVQWLDAKGADVGEVRTWRIGQTWEWNPPTKLADNRLKPGERRVHAVARPEGASAARVRLSSHRMSLETARYHHLEGRYPLSLITHEHIVQESPTVDPPAATAAAATRADIDVGP